MNKTATSARITENAEFPQIITCTRRTAKHCPNKTTKRVCVSPEDRENFITGKSLHHRQPPLALETIRRVKNLKPFMIEA